MTASGRCPSCGGELRADVRRNVAFRRCLSCAATVLDAATFDGLVPPEGQKGPQRRDYDHVGHHPQEDLGYTAAHPQPPFPQWAAGGGPDGVGLMFGP